MPATAALESSFLGKDFRELGFARIAGLVQFLQVMAPSMSSNLRHRTRAVGHSNMAGIWLTGSVRLRRPACTRSAAAAILFVLLCPSGNAQNCPIHSLVFEGNKSIGSPILRAQIRSTREGVLYNPEVLNWELRNIEKYYQDQGFLRVKVGPPSVDFLTDTAGTRVVDIRVPVSEGPLFTTGQIRVKDAHVFEPATLLQMCPLRTGLAYSRQKMAQWQDKIADGYRTMGYIRFHATAHEEVHELQKVIDCTLECNEGAEYSVGKISVAINESIDLLDFKRHLLLGEGGLFNPEMISLSIQFLNQMHVYKPIAESDVEVQIDDEKKTVDLIFHLALLRKGSAASRSWYTGSAMK
ncbi:MAG TPA: POTRA domain-containing protein [Acidobacteriota bacterium]|nr:POTRA domain-containing protein [Acidobacteriota bacterium]